MLYRLLFAAILLLALWRPRPLEADRSGLTLAVAFGVTLAAMNFCFYEALDRIPLGIAVTLEFVGPLTVALVGSRRALDLVWVAAAAAGVVLLAGPSGSAGSRRGFALLAGAFWAAYIVLSARIGRVFPGGRGLALAMGFAAALMVLPGSLAAGGDLIDPGAAAVGAAAGTELGDPLLARARGPQAARGRDLRRPDEPRAGGGGGDRAGRARPGARRDRGDRHRPRRDRERGRARGPGARAPTEA